MHPSVLLLARFCKEVGLLHFVGSPGSRSAPILLALSRIGGSAPFLPEADGRRDVVRSDTQSDRQEPQRLEAAGTVRARRAGRMPATVGNARVEHRPISAEGGNQMDRETEKPETATNAPKGLFSWLKIADPAQWAPDVAQLQQESVQRLGFIRSFLRLPFGPGRLALYQGYLDRLMRAPDGLLPSGTPAAGTRQGGDHDDD